MVGYFPARVEVWLPTPFFFSPAAACQASKFGPGVEMEGDSGGGQGIGEAKEALLLCPLQITEPSKCQGKSEVLCCAAGLARL